MTRTTSKPVPGNDQTSVAVLAGGQSSRMGSDKALLRLIPDGPTLLERVIEATSVLSDDLFIVSRFEHDYRSFGIPVTADQYPGTGVLGAMGTALRHAANSKVLIVSCDMPFLCQAALAWMATIEEPYDALVPVTDTQTRQGGEITYQTLHAIYRKSCLPAIENYLREGNRKASAFLDKVDLRQVSEMEIRRFDPGLLSFMSVNTPVDLRQAVELERTRQSTEAGIT